MPKAAKAAGPPMSGGLPARVAILGAESSGTRYMTRLIHQAGLETLHRSFPYGIGSERRWPHDDVAHFWPHAVVVMTRDWWATAASQVAAGYVSDTSEAWSNLRSTSIRIARLVAELQVPFHHVSYESLVQRPETVIGNVCVALGMPVPVFEAVVDGNAKYLDQGA